VKARARTFRLSLQAAIFFMGFSTPKPLLYLILFNNKITSDRLLNRKYSLQSLELQTCLLLKDLGIFETAATTKPLDDHLLLSEHEGIFQTATCSSESLDRHLPLLEHQQGSVDLVASDFPLSLQHPIPFRSVTTIVQLNSTPHHQVRLRERATVRPRVQEQP
jgi:hypothetical protein